MHMPNNIYYKNYPRLFNKTTCSLVGTIPVTQSLEDIFPVIDCT